MKRQIRYGIWESNSSSSHCIFVTKNDHVLTTDDITTSYKEESDNKEYFYVDSNGEWSIWDGDLYFGRGFKVCASLEDKACYAIAEFCGDYSDLKDEEKAEKMNEIQEIISSVIPKLEYIKLPTKFEPIFVDIDDNELDFDDVMTDWEVNDQSAMHFFYKKDGKKHPAKKTGYGYDVPKVGGIDHQSQGMLTQFLISKGITLKEFLLNKKYIVVEDSDESCYIDTMKKSDLFNKDNVVEEYTPWDAYLESKILDPEFKEWLDEQEENEE